MAIADLDAEDGGFHGDIPDVFHLGFDRQELTDKLKGKGFSAIHAVDASLKKKTQHRSG
ncbi:MAG: hypothetical protein R2875_09795 [Desulfobacterales bacterium]